MSALSQLNCEIPISNAVASSRENREGFIKLFDLTQKAERTFYNSKPLLLETSEKIESSVVVLYQNNEPKNVFFDIEGSRVAFSQTEQSVVSCNQESLLSLVHQLANCENSYLYNPSSSQGLGFDTFDSVVVVYKQ